MWCLPVFVVVASLFVWLASGRYISTDNAYVKGDRAAITTELSGIVVEVPVQENQHVSRGQLLFKLDDKGCRSGEALKSRQTLAEAGLLSATGAPMELEVVHTEVTTANAGA